MPTAPRQRGATPFFSPRADEVAGNDTDADLRIPATLKRQIFFVNQQLRWNIRSGQTNSKRAGRHFLEAGGLVNEYRATELFPVIARALRNKPSPARSRDSLQWVYRFTQSREAVPWAEISAVELRVPTRDGEWIPARTALFSAEWGDAESQLLEDLVARAGAASSELADLGRRFILAPAEWAFPVEDVDVFAEFLGRIGVRRGLWPEELPRSTIERDGRWFEDVSASTSVPMAPASRALWQSVLEACAPRDCARTRPTVRSRRSFGSPDRMTTTRSTIRQNASTRSCSSTAWNSGLPRCWTSPSVATTTAPTPSRADPCLRVPGTGRVDADGERRRADRLVLRRPEYAWSHRGGDDVPPNFAPLVPAVVRRLVETRDTAHASVVEIGVNYWDAPRTAPARIRLLAQLLATDVVPDKPQHLSRRCTKMRGRRHRPRHSCSVHRSPGGPSHRHPEGTDSPWSQSPSSRTRSAHLHSGRRYHPGATPPRTARISTRSAATWQRYRCSGPAHRALRRSDSPRVPDRCDSPCRWPFVRTLRRRNASRLRGSGLAARPHRRTRRTAIRPVP